MGLLLSTRRALLGGTGGYNDLVLGTGPIAYWPQDEPAGTTARCLVNPAQNGTYTGVTLADDNTGPFGTPAPYFDGATSFVDIMTAPLVDAWDAGGAEWSIMVWWKVFDATVWAGIGRYILRAYADINNRVYMNLAFDGFWVAGGASETNSIVGLTSTDWMCTVVTRSESADEIRYYRNDAWLATDTTIGNWASAAPWDSILLGASFPLNLWYGWMAHFAMWDRALPPAEVLALATV